MASYLSRAFACLLLLLFVPLHVRAQALFEFNLPAQPLGDSLRAVASRAHVNVAFDPATVANRTAPPLKGTHSPQGAMELLLRGSGLRVQATAGGSYWVEAIPGRNLSAMPARNGAGDH